MRGKWALITGATAGIGEACANRLAQNGVNLLLTGRREERLAALQKRLIDAHGISAKTLAFDIRNREDTERALDSVRPEIGHLEILINNAGLALGTEELHLGSVDDFETMIDTNVKGLLYVTKFCLPFMVKNNRGHIVNLGSVAGRWVYPGGAVYCATKFAVRALSEGMRLDLLGTKIRVTNIEPGMVETEFSEVRFRGDKSKAKAVYQGLEPLRAEDIADAVVWCLQRPPHVNIHEMVIFPTDQAGVGPYVHRRN